MIIVEAVLLTLMALFWAIGIVLYPLKWVCDSMFLTVDALGISMNRLSDK